MTTHVVNTKVYLASKDFYYLGKYTLNKTSYTAVEYNDFSIPVIEEIKTAVKTNQINGEGYTQTQFLAYLETVIDYLKGTTDQPGNASANSIGVTKLTLDPVLASNPIAVGANDPKYQNSLSAKNNLSDLQSIPQARKNLGLGTAATSNIGDFDPAGTAGSVLQALSDHEEDYNNPHHVTAAQVGLGNVEDTRLSTWPGSANITRLGNITSGSIPYYLITGAPTGGGSGGGGGGNGVYLYIQPDAPVVAPGTRYQWTQTDPGTGDIITEWYDDGIH